MLTNNWTNLPKSNRHEICRWRWYAWNQYLQKWSKLSATDTLIFKLNHNLGGSLITDTGIYVTTPPHGWSTILSNKESAHPRSRQLSAQSTIEDQFFYNRAYPFLDLHPTLLFPTWESIPIQIKLLPWEHTRSRDELGFFWMVILVLEYHMQCRHSIPTLNYDTFFGELV